MSRSFLRQQGISLIEVIVGVTIISVIAVVIGYSVTTYVDARSQLLNNMKNVYLAEEGYEILRVLRDDNWETIEALSLGTTYYLSVATSTLAISGTPEVIDNTYYRSFELAGVYRDSNDDIVPSTEPGATLDDQIVEVTVSAWGPTATSSFTGLLSNLHAI